MWILFYLSFIRATLLHLSCYLHQRSLANSEVTFWEVDHQDSVHVPEAESQLGSLCHCGRFC